MNKDIVIYSWDQMANYLLDSGIDTEIDFEYSVFFCPECGEPINKEDYNDFPNGCCPRCEIILIEEEEN